MLSLHKQKKFKVKIAIVGAGAAGLFLAALLSKHPQLQIYVLEKSTKTGTKLKASGGGKANLLNAHISGDCYNNAAFVNKLLQQVDGNKVLQAFHDMGLATVTDEAGRIYPASLYAPAVVEVLYANMKNNVHILTETEVKTLEYRSSGWHVGGVDMFFDRLVLATGTPAGMIRKNRAGYNDYLSCLDIKINAYKPSLTGFKIKHYPAMLHGCRTRAVVKLWQGKTLLFEERGELTFKEDGVSGIVILNASAIYNRLKNKNGCYLMINFLYYDERFDIQQYLQQHASLCGVVHPKINELYCKQHIDVQNYRMDIEEPYDYEFAQVCTGGIATEELTADFELKAYPHLYAIGEMLDIDGVCGGYNLFFAFASAYTVAQNIVYGDKNSEH